MNRQHAHRPSRPSRIREAIDVLAFFVALVVIVLLLSLDGVS